MLDGIGKDLCFAFAILTGVLLGAEDNGLGAVQLVDAVDNSIQALHLLKLFGVKVKQVGLYRAVRSYSHDDDSRFLVVIAREIELFQ